MNWPTWLNKGEIKHKDKNEQRKRFKLVQVISQATRVVTNNLVQVISQATRVVTNSTGMKSSTRIDHIFTNAAEMCLKAVSRSIGCSDHNIVAISRKIKVPKAGPNIVYKRSYNKFCSDP